MNKTISPEFMDLFEKKAYAHLVTLMPDGSPQVTPLWVNYQDGLILINTARGRQKDLNMTRDPRVAIELQDPDNPYRYLSIRGLVVEITEVGAEDHIDQLSIKYTGNPYQWRVPGQVRVTYKIQPIKIDGHGN